MGKFIESRKMKTIKVRIPGSMTSDYFIMTGTDLPISGNPNNFPRAFIDEFESMYYEISPVMLGGVPIYRGVNDESLKIVEK